MLLNLNAQTKAFLWSKKNRYNTERFIWGYIAIVQVYSTLLEYFTNETIA